MFCTFAFLPDANQEQFLCVYALQGERRIEVNFKTRRISNNV